jgi:hypothetical protein
MSRREQRRQHSPLGQPARAFQSRYAFKIALLGAAALLVALVWAKARYYHPAEFGPTETGEVTVVSVVAGSHPSKGNPASQFAVLVRLASGRELYASVPHPLPTGEHLWATYSVAKERNVMRMGGFRQCGLKACSLGPDANEPR